MTNAMAMRHRRRAVPASRRGRNVRSTLSSRAHVRSRRQERGKPVIFRAPSTASRSRRPCSIQSTVAHRARSRPLATPRRPPRRRTHESDARESALIARAARRDVAPFPSLPARSRGTFHSGSLPPLDSLRFNDRRYRFSLRDFEARSRYRIQAPQVSSTRMFYVLSYTV